MDRINLLPEGARLNPLERVLQRVDREFPKVLLGGVGAVAAVTLILSTGQALSLQRWKRKQVALKEEIQLMQVESKNLESFVKQLDQVELELTRQKNVLQQKEAYLSAVKARPRVWATVLKDLRRNIPHGVWLTELETNQGGTLRISGGATDEDLVTEFMSSLKASPHFSQVSFNYTEKDQIGRVTVVRFEVVCRVL